MEAVYEEWADEGEVIDLGCAYYTYFKLASDTINSLLDDEIEWIDINFIEEFELKYSHLSLSNLDEVSLLMYEASLKFSEEAIYDIYQAAMVFYDYTQSNIYLLSKAIDYCQSYNYPLKIFFDIRHKAKYFDDFRLLADSLKIIFDKYATEILDTFVLDHVELLLLNSRELANSDNEKLLLSFSYFQNGYISEGEDLIEITISSLLQSIQEKK